MSQPPPTLPDPLYYAAPIPFPPLPRPRVWPAYVSFLALLATVLGSQIVLVLIASIWLGATGTKPGDLRSELMSMLTEPPFFAAIIVMTIAIEFCASLIPAWLSPVPLQRRLGLLSARLPWITLIAASVGAVGYALAFECAADLLELNSPALEHLAEAVNNSAGITAAAIFVAISFAGPLAEELFFRGYLQTRLVARHGPFLGILVSALFFGIMHMDPVHSAFAFGFGIILGTIAWRAGSILPAVFAHMLNNTFATVSAWFMPMPQTAEGLMLLGGIGAGLALLFMLPVLLIRPRPLAAA